MTKEYDTARYQVRLEEAGYRFRFFCALSGMIGCETEPIAAENDVEALSIAWMKEGRHQFNRCKKCGRWVSDAMYNADVCECVDCAPWENEPHYCSQCGEPVKGSATYCSRCGIRLRYQEVWE